MAMRRNPNANIDAMSFLVSLPPSPYLLHTIVVPSQRYYLLCFHAEYTKEILSRLGRRNMGFSRLDCVET